jgi:hypothetical protein
MFQITFSDIQIYSEVTEICSFPFSINVDRAPEKFENSSGLKMETVCFSKMLVFTYESTRHHNPEQHCHDDNCKNLKSQVRCFIVLFKDLYVG